MQPNQLYNFVHLPQLHMLVRHRSVAPLSVVKDRWYRFREQARGNADSMMSDISNVRCMLHAKYYNCIFSSMANGALRP